MVDEFVPVMLSPFVWIDWLEERDADRLAFQFFVLLVFEDEVFCSQKSRVQVALDLVLLTFQRPHDAGCEIDDIS